MENHEALTAEQQLAPRTASASHTPGPWSFSPYMQDAAEIAEIEKLGLHPTRKLTNEGQAIVLAVGPVGVRIALVDCQAEFKRGKGYQTDCEERSANARLIAAAPEMLDALRQWKYAQDNKDAVEMVNAQIARDLAIAKAAGAA